MTLPQIASPAQWRAARIELLAKEKAMTRARDALSTSRRELPMVEIDKEYVSAGPLGAVGLLDLFEGRRQLIVEHFMFDPDWDAGAASFISGEQPIEVPGLSCFLRDGDTVFHTYSTFARGTEMTGGSYYFLDLTALGRQEDWEEPRGRAGAPHSASPDFAG